MQYKTDEQIAMEEQALKDEGATFHKWGDVVDIYGTGVFKDMKKGQKYPRVHKLTAKVLVDKKYAVYDKDDIDDVLDELARNN